MACTLCPFSFSIPFVLQAGRLLIDGMYSMPLLIFNSVCFTGCLLIDC